MEDIESFYESNLLQNGFQIENTKKPFNSMGKLFKLPEKLGNGFYWVYGEKDLYDIKIHDFYFHKDSFFDLKMFEWPECLSISYYESVSGEELMPYRHITAGCVKTFINANAPYKAIFHKNIPIRTIGIEIMPAYYEKYLKEAYPNEYIAPHDAFKNIGQTNNFPKMVSLLREVWNYNGNGLAAKLFYAAKVAEAVSLIVEHNKNLNPVKSINVSSEDIELLENVTAYINDHFNCKISLEHLSHIACMGTTKLKLLFNQIYDCTISTYIQQRRLSHAETLLASTDFSIEQISQIIGYSNSGRFASIFRKSTGLFPRQYRKMSQKDVKKIP